MAYAPAHSPHLGLGQTPDEADPGLIDRLGSNVDAAIAYLREQWDRFVTMSSSIIDLQHEAAELAYRYKQAGDLERQAQAQAVIRKLGELNQLHNKLVGRMVQVADVVGVGLGSYTGLGAIPVVQVTIITGLAAGVAWFFRAASLEQQKLDMLRAGHDPAEIAAMDSGPAPLIAGVGGIVRWAVLGVALWAAYRLVQESGGLPQRNPPLVVYDTNPPGGVIGDETLAVWYRHAEDGGLYVHEFGPDVELVARDDGTVCLEHADVPLWQDYGRR